jgi:hypothetical protein
MKRIAALLRKELVQHGWLLVALAIFLPLCWGLLILVVLAAPATVTYVEAHATFLRFFVPLAGLAIGNRLVVAEYHGRTQLFLEALPIGRLDVPLVKLGLGLVILEVIALGSLVATLAVASSREPIDLAFTGILAARTSVFVLCLWAFFFAMGLLGRLRIPMYLAIGLGMMVIAGTTELELVRFGPFALAYGDDLPLERETWPVEALGIALALAAAWIALGIGLATLREGSVAETLAKPMSQREKVTFGVTFFSLFVTYLELDPPNQRPPLVWPDRGVARSASLPIEVQYLDEDARDDADALIARLERELAPLVAAMGWAALPRTRVSRGERLDGTTFEPVDVAEDDGLLVRANFVRSPEWDEDGLVTEVVGLALDAHTDRGSLFEPNEWVRDGLAAMWPHRGEGELPREMVLRALWATRARGPDAPRLRAWDRVREREGMPVALSLAASGVHLIARERGLDRALALGRALFSARPPRDLRAVIAARRRPVAVLLPETTGWDEPELISRWSAWLASQRGRADLAASIGAMPRGEASVALEASESGIDAVARVRLDAPLAPGTTVTLLHFGIGPFDDAIDPHDLLREERVWPEGALELELRVRGRYGPGERAWLGVDVESAELGALRLAQTRATAPRAAGGAR